MQAVQKRVSMTSDVLGAIKGMKMLGLTEMITGKVQDMREHELDMSRRFRRVQIANITLGMSCSSLPEPEFNSCVKETRRAYCLPSSP